jgi:hypothetical protein
MAKMKGLAIIRGLRATSLRNTRFFAINHQFVHVKMPETAMITNNVNYSAVFPVDIPIFHYFIL